MINQRFKLGLFVVVVVMCLLTLPVMATARSNGDCDNDVCIPACENYGFIKEFIGDELHLTIINSGTGTLQINVTAYEYYYTWFSPRHGVHIPRFHIRSWVETYVVSPGSHSYVMHLEKSQNHLYYDVRDRCAQTTTPEPTPTPTPTPTPDPGIPVPEFPTMALPTGMIFGGIGVIYLIKSKKED